jgi:phage terminase Nu1 subunit (DNA packaging protein)
MGTPASLPRLERPQVAELLRANFSTIGKWEREGLPIAEPGARGKATQYDAAAVVAWYVQRQVERVSGNGSGRLSADDARARKDMTQAELNEQKLALQRGEALPRAVYDHELAQVLMPFRARVLAAPRAWALALTQLAPEGPGAVEAELTRRVRELLTDLSTLRVRTPRKGRR